MGSNSKSCVFIHVIYTIQQVQSLEFCI